MAVPGFLSAAILILVLVASFQSGEAQGNTTDPNEVQALKEFGETLGLSPPWDFSVDPCSGLNGWGNIQGADNFQKSSGIECDCTIDNSSSFCNVIKLVVISNLVSGTISPAIGNLTHLRNLNLQANLITGEIPEELGSLKSMEFITVASNRLTGPLPKSIGNLNRLESLSIAVNEFSGTVPKEFGGLTSLTKLYMDSTGLGGELPAEFGMLQKLAILNMFDNNFNGTIPAFLGNMSSLEEVKLFGNKFSGPIPSELGSLKNLKTLEIGEVSSGGTIPSSFNLLRNLTGLMLRNCQLTGTLPQFENLTKLESLDLSTNNLTGSIPSSFASLPLQRLYLGSNQLTGVLPAFKSLTALDVSFNQLNGSLPQLNGNFTLAWNNFTSDRPIQLNSELRTCLEEKRNCGSVNGGRTARFGINCGGPTITVDGLTFYEDTADYSNGTGTYYSSQGSWALTSTGYAQSFKTSPQYFESIDGSQGDQTLLYQSARTSPLSVRYFGLGMQAGDYTVRLHFAEIIMGISSDRPGLGRRFFDVYIQGDRKLTDLNIKNEANGAAKALVKSFEKVRVSDGVLDIHLLWSGKGTCCAPFRTYGPLISAVEVVPEFDAVDPAGESQSSRGLKIGFGVAVPMLAVLVLCCFLFWRAHNRRKRSSHLDEDTEELRLLDGKLHIYSYDELRNATREFSADNLVGKGAFGSVYKGVLLDGTPVAVKQLIPMKQNTKDFVNEATLISGVRHRNLVKLLGCCVEGANRMLVLEYLENNSLHQALLSSRTDQRLNLDWPTRFNICLGVAKGLAYLHEESSPRIIHRDIKANNVILDRKLVPKIADFGLAKLYEDHQSHISTQVAGTIGYLAPEYALRGLLTEKADVYSYGVLVLEIVSGRPNMNVDLEFLLDDAWRLHESNRLLELLDKRADNPDEDQVLRVIQVALSCTQPSPNSRPTMSKVVAMLTGSEIIDVSSLVPGYFSLMEITTKLGPQISKNTTSTSTTTNTSTTGTSTGSSSSNIPGTDTPWRGSSSGHLLEPR